MRIRLTCVLVALAMSAAAVSSAASLNARSFGATGGGRKDDSAAVQKALDKCAAKGGGTVKLPAGKYRLDNPISVPSGVTLSGEWEAPHHAQLTKGTVILVYAGRGKEDAPPLISLAPSSGVKGLTFFYPEQRVPGTQPYPWTIQGRGMHGSVQDVTLVNAYKGINFGTEWHELHYIRNVFGCPLKFGVFIDQCSDIGRIENVHFNPHYWIRAEVKGIPRPEDLASYLWKNLTAFYFGRTDWQYVFNTFAYGCKVGYYFAAAKTGECNGNFVGIAADRAETSILVEETGGPGVLITNGQFVGGAGSEVIIEVKPTHTGAVQLSNCSFWGASLRIARVAGDGLASFSQCNFRNWSVEGADFPAIEVSGGDLILQGCRFGRDSKQVMLQPGAKTAVIMGNRMAGEFKVENRSEADLSFVGNVSRTKGYRE